MRTSTDLRILFPTSFSDSCFRSARAIAQMADTSAISLTIAHVAKPGGSKRHVRRELDSFMAEADHYDDCRRVLMERHNAIEAIADLCQEEEFDLVMAPASDRLGVHSLFTPSFRGKLLKACRAPVWTAASALDRADFKKPIQTVACLVEFEGGNETLLPLAAAFAAHYGAKLHVTGVLPEISESTLKSSLYTDAPLLPEAAIFRTREAFAGQPCAGIDIVTGDVRRELPRLLRECGADLVFIGPGQAVRGNWIPRRATFLDLLPCPAICVDGASAGFRQWSFQKECARAETRSLAVCLPRADRGQPAQGLTRLHR